MRWFFVKKLFVIILMLIPMSCFAAELNFDFAGDGKFIYCNNPEGIEDDGLMNGKNPSYIMNNEALSPGTYYLYLSHVNYTGSGKRGYDIELDVEMTASSDECVYTVKNAAFETADVTAYMQNGSWIKEENDWGYLNCCAKMLGKPICNIYGEDFYYPYADGEFTAKSFKSAKNETNWLSSVTPDYRKVHFYQPVHMQAIIIIEKGSLNLNVCAFKSGENIGDRSGFNPNASFGSYKRDKTVKGIADTMPIAKADLEYTIDDTVSHETALPVTIRNQYVPDGNTVTQWLTNLNPQADAWSKKTLAQSDMLYLKYKDSSKLDFYGENIPENLRSDIWSFDVFHSDTSKYEPSFNTGNAADYSPNFILGTDRINDSYACNLGNYGVTASYSLKVTNNGNKTRYFEYVVTTASNVIVYATDKNGDFTHAYSKKYLAEPKSDVMESVELPPNQTTEFTLNLILPVNFNGGIKNQFIISDVSNNHPSYDDFADKAPVRNAYSPIFGEYLSLLKQQLPQDVYQKFDGNFDSFEATEGNGKYLIRWCAWDGKPYYYYNGWNFNNTVYVLDSDFNLINEYSFGALPVAASFDGSAFFIKTAEGKFFKSSNGTDWEESSYFPTDGVKIVKDCEVPQWATDELNEAVQLGIVPNTLKDTGMFENSITRREFCSIAAKLLKICGEKVPGEIQNSFIDTNDGNVKWLSSLGILNGYTDNTFKPENLITREEAAAVLSRLCNYLGIWSSDYSEPYGDDSEIESWAKSSVYKMRNAKIMNGTAENTFSPDSEYSRIQSVATMLRVYKLL